jgi:hypothetical protein
LKKLLLLPVLLIFIGKLSAQADTAKPKTTAPDTSLHRLHFPYDHSGFAVVAGIHQGSYTFFEAGIAHVSDGSNGCAFGTYFNSVALSAEYNPFNQRAGIMLTGMSSIMTMQILGLSLNSYTDFNSYTFGIRPMIGLGNGFFALTYGYNFQLLNREAFPLNKHCVSFRIHLGDFFAK